MTTVAFDGKTFACDSRLNGNFIDKKKIKKIFRINTASRDMIVGFAGDIAMSLAFIDWLKADQCEDIAIDGDFNALVYDINLKKLSNYTNSLYPIDVGIPNAIGSGSPYAMGAMMAGANAVKAVKIACKLDRDSGLPLYKIEI